MTVTDFHSTAERAVDFALSEGHVYWLHVPKGSKLNDQPFAIVAVDRGLTVYHGLIGCLSGHATHIKLVEPHPVSEKENHTFECRECGLPRTYTMKLN